MKCAQLDNVSPEASAPTRIGLALLRRALLVVMGIVRCVDSGYKRPMGADFYCRGLGFRKVFVSATEGIDA